jgi:uncharacterized protein (DUF1697 family)
MPRYVALVRGVNLGGHTVKMDRLKKLFEELGFKNVETFIASGNVIFETASKSAAALEKKITGHLEKSLGFPALTFLRTDRELAAVLEHDALADDGWQSIYVGFLAAGPSKESHERLMSYRTKHDDFHVSGREVYWRCKTHMSDSPFFRVGLEKALGTKVTVRNVTTVTKLVEKFLHGQPMATKQKSTTRKTKRPGRSAK